MTLIDNVRSLTDRLRERAHQAGTPPEPWTELPHDPAHPTYENARRYFIARRDHDLHHDRNEAYETVAVTATYVDVLGEQIELGPWSLSTREARELARSLVELADTIEPNHNGGA
ncbi:hypothetical protein [Rhodococcus pyridinivorans]|uniref:hypothetical protein n=1 Tax=Rhodococcus pyridinivorans TaxID=103816 RepID=UPI002284E46F|nr:hypothetical protein [Rhodococcus pyridinivorans]WAL46796.1 hypothetical protein OQN32_01400 [Rhodococcus pyridinivorans]